METSEPDFIPETDFATATTDAIKSYKPRLGALRPGPVTSMPPQLREPIKVTGNGPRPDVQALKKSTEERAYYILYYNLELEEYKWKKFIGRYNTYFGLRDILDAESVDLKASRVLVEIVGIDAVTNEARTFLTDFASAPNLIKFHAMMEPFFGSDAWSMAEYDYGYSIEEDDDESETDFPTVPNLGNARIVTSKEIGEKLQKATGATNMSVQDAFYRSQEDFKFQTEDENGSVGAFLSKEERDAIMNQRNDVTPTEYLNGVQVKNI